MPEALDAPTEGLPVLAGTERDHRSAFRVAIVVLALLAAAAIAAFVVLLSRPGASPAEGWSAWAPTAKDADSETVEIANHVGAGYRLPSGAQLVAVQASPLVVQEMPVSFIAIQSAPGGFAYTGDSIPVYSDVSATAVSYLLCGLGEACAITEDEPTEERARLLRREALELALYTFRYVDGKDFVVVFMPPRPGDQPTYALFFQRADLEPLLDAPLRTTLPGENAPLADAMTQTEADLVDRLTESRLYAFQFSQLQDGRAFLVLNDPSRVPPPEPTTTDESGASTGTP